METFWIKYYTAPQLRSQLDGSGLFLVLIGIANIGIGVWIVEDSTQYASQLSLMVSAALSILIGAFIILVISISYARPTTRGRSKDQSPIDTESRLFKDICGLIARMNYSSPLALVYESRTRSWIPSVFKLNSKMYALVVPAGLMLLKRGERLALLAHEIAHIEQDDVGLWLASDRLAAGLRVVALLLLSILAISLAATLAVGRQIAPYAIGYSIQLFQIIRLRQRVKEFKRYSETRADFAAIVHTDGVKLQSALSHLTTDDDDHLPLADRLELVSNTTRRWPADRPEQNDVIWYRYP